ncbi:hypothetical protein [Methylomonas sp. UP202]|uniref:hypothetical protein n=1 Tax=Methylomonas sp. UP202 TaxID=3040943 RepID=UPI00247A68EC|nr:hypothetical protein [Methylomonas sp. UP202]WGS84861.1 hypothetical protein QC632_17630 [Methylomonas sp. UP202]
MHQLVAPLIVAALTMWITNTSATETITVPDKVRTNVLKRHPQAEELKATGNEIHFKNPLLAISYKTAEGDTKMELFRNNGALFTNKMALEAPSEGLPPELKKALTEQFPGGQIKKAELIVNPNGIGEEYEIHVDVGGTLWHVAGTDNGEITEKIKD